MKTYILMGFLGVNTWMDLRRRRVALWSAAAVLLAGIIYQTFYTKQATELLLGIVPGIALVLISKLTEGALGMGDALVMLALGSVLGLSEGLQVLTAALLLAAVWAGILLVIRGRKKNYEFPFIPFLLLGYVGRCLLCVGSL